MRAAILVLTACGRVGFDGDASPNTCAGRTFAAPAASSFVDDFSSGDLAARWQPVDPCITETGGEVVAAPLPSGRYCHAWDQGAFHLTCDSIAMRVPEVTAPELGVQTFIYVYDLDGQQNLNLLLEAGGFGLGSGGGPVYDASMQWWRIGEDGGNVYFDTSPDGASWTRGATIATPFSLDNVQIAIGAGTYKPVASPGRARFHCYNVPPPCI